MNHALTSIANIPVTTSVIKSCYQELSHPDKKVISLEKSGEIIRVKRGLYVVSPDVTGKMLSKELIANHLYAPSYVSMLTALRYYGLIPEAVYTTQSMTVKHSRTFDTPLGRFDFVCTSRETFPVGITSIQKEGYSFLMASPEKALCDLIATSPKVNLRYLKDLAAYLEEDIRFDMDALSDLDVRTLEDYAAIGKKGRSIKLLIKFMEKAK